MRFSVAADGLRHLESRATGRGGGVLRADRSQPVPAGDSHALAAGSEVTECGRPASALAPFPDIDFEVSPFVQKCRECTRAVRESTATTP